MGFITKSNSAIYLDREITAGSNKVQITNGDGITGNTEIDVNVDNIFPDQTGNNGKFLSTDGTVSSWENVPTPDLEDLLPTTARGNFKALVSYNPGTGNTTRWGYSSIGEWHGFDDIGSFPFVTSSGYVADAKVGYYFMTNPGVDGSNTMFATYYINIIDNGTGAGNVTMVNYTIPAAPGDVLWTGVDHTTGTPVYAFHEEGNTTNYMPIYAAGKTYPFVTGSRIVLNAIYRMSQSVE